MVTTLADIAPQKVAWLWFGYLPSGKIVILDGDPGLGKSSIAIDLAARVSKGLSMPPSVGKVVTKPQDVFVLTSEDGLADTVRPRLDAAGADVSRVHTLEIPGDLVRIPDHVPHLQEAMRDRDARLVIVDPLMGFTSGKHRANVGQEMRQALRPVVELAEAIGATVLLVRHLRKGDASKALYRGGGAIDIIGQARVGLAVAADPADSETRLLVATKSNLAQIPPTLAYRLVDCELTGAARVQWEPDARNISADELLAEAPPAQRSWSKPDPIRESANHVRRLLAQGPRKASEVREELEANGLPAPRGGSAAQKLKKFAGFEHTRVKGDGGSYYMWYLPSDEVA